MKPRNYFGMDMDNSVIGGSGGMGGAKEACLPPLLFARKKEDEKRMKEGRKVGKRKDDA